MFWPVVGASAAASLVLFAAIYSYWRYFPHTRHQRRVADMKALRDLLLYHVDDLEDILEALQKQPELGPGRFHEITRIVNSVKLTSNIVMIWHAGSPVHLFMSSKHTIDLYFELNLPGRADWEMCCPVWMQSKVALVCRNAREDHTDGQRRIRRAGAVKHSGLPGAHQHSFLQTEHGNASLLAKPAPTVTMPSPCIPCIRIRWTADLMRHTLAH